MLVAPCENSQVDISTDVLELLLTKGHQGITCICSVPSLPCINSLYRSILKTISLRIFSTHEFLRRRTIFNKRKSAYQTLEFNITRGLSGYHMAGKCDWSLLALDFGDLRDATIQENCVVIVRQI